MKYVAIESLQEPRCYSELHFVHTQGDFMHSGNDKMNPYAEKFPFSLSECIKIHLSQTK